MTKTFEEKMVDRLGELRAEMKALKNEAADIEDYLKSAGDGRYDGERYSAMVTTANRTTVDWKGIALKMKASEYMKKAYSKVAEVCTLKLTAHKKEMA